MKIIGLIALALYRASVLVMLLLITGLLLDEPVPEPLIWVASFTGSFSILTNLE